jgi:tetratricopeptide (TPR) repeat protein
MHRIWLVLALIIVIAGSYYSSFPGAFHYDDYPLLLENPRVLESDFDYSSFLYQYGGRPLTLWVFHVNHQLAGANPFGFHVVSIGLHVLVVLLLFVLVAQWTGQTAVGFLTALFFAVHPAQVQAVNYIWSRSVLLMSAFILLALITRRPWLHLTFFQLAIWSRAEALVALVPLIWRNPKKWKGFALLASVNLVCFILGFLLENPANVGWNHPDVLAYWLTAAQAFWMYGYLALLPDKFSLYHSALQLGWQSLLALAILLATGGITWAIHKRWPWIAKGVIWFALFLAPGLLVPNAAQFHESRLYLALAGLCLLAAWCLTRLDPDRIPGSAALASTLGDPGHPVEKAIRRPRRRRVARLLPAVLLVAAFVATTHNRNSIWLSETALWKEAVQRYPTDFVPHYNLAVAYARQGENAAAESEFLMARNLNDSDDLAYAGLGYCAESRKHWHEALAHYESALVINPANRYATESLQRVREIITSERLAP